MKRDRKLYIGTIGNKRNAVQIASKLGANARDSNPEETYKYS